MRVLTVRVQPFIHVDLVSECMAQGQSSKEHLDADDEVLVTGSNGSLTDWEVCRVDLRNRSTFFKDGQQHSWTRGKTFARAAELIHLCYRDVDVEYYKNLKVFSGIHLSFQSELSPIFIILSFSSLKWQFCRSFYTYHWNTCFKILKSLKKIKME